MAIEIREAGARDTERLARLRWRWREEGSTPPRGTFDAFASDFTDWRSAHASVITVVADDGDALVGMGFLALVDRVPWPDALDRRFGDVQSVYVVPERRGDGLGAGIVRALVALALDAGCVRVTVHAADRAVPIYEREGFEHVDRLMLRAFDT